MIANFALGIIIYLICFIITQKQWTAFALAVLVLAVWHFFLNRP